MNTKATTQIEAMKLALGKIKSARDCHFAAIDTLLFEAEEILEAALAEQPAQGCDFCNNPLYAGTVCKNCGRLAEQPAQSLPFGVGGGLVAIKTLLSRDPCGHANTAIQMIDAILAEQPAQQEPVATKLETQQFSCFHVSAEDFQRLKNLPVGTKLYTSPPPQRKPLTDEEIAYEAVANNWDWLKFARAIEAKIKENT